MRPSYALFSVAIITAAAPAYTMPFRSPKIIDTTFLSGHKGIQVGEGILGDGTVNAVGDVLQNNSSQLSQRDLRSRFSLVSTDALANEFLKRDINPEEVALLGRLLQSAAVSQAHELERRGSAIGKSIPGSIGSAISESAISALTNKIFKRDAASANIQTHNLGPNARQLGVPGDILTDIFNELHPSGAVAAREAAAALPPQVIRTVFNNNIESLESKREPGLDELE